MDSKCTLVFLGYEKADGELRRVKKPGENEDQTQTLRLELSAFENGMYTGKIITGELKLCKDEMHDLLNGEALEGRALFALKIVD